MPTKSFGQSPRQLELLRKIGVEVWRFRDTETADPDARVEAQHADVSASESANATATADVNQSPDTPPDETDETLDDIAREVSTCQKCALHQSRTNTVFGCGDAQANWLFIGEAPGQNEDEQGQPFVGRAGKLLDMMIAALDMKREQVFIANVLKCRPPDNRDPNPDEVAQCESFLHRQLALIRPRVIVALGRVSAQALLKTDTPIGKLRGQQYHYGADKIPLIVTYHPAYLLRSPTQKAKAWEDLWQAKMIVS